MSGKLVGTLLIAGLLALPRVALAEPGNARPTEASNKATRDALTGRVDSPERDQKLRAQLGQTEKATLAGDTTREDEPARRSAITRRSSDRKGDERRKAEHLAVLAERLKRGERGLGPQLVGMHGDQREKKFEAQREEHNRENGMTADDRENSATRKREIQLEARDERTNERQRDKREGRDESKEIKVVELKLERDEAKKDAKEDAKQERLAELKDQKADAKKEVTEERTKERRDERQREETDSRRTGTTTSPTAK